MIRGGTIVYWYAPRWRRALYRLGVKRHRARLGDVKRAEQLEAEQRARELFFATEHNSIPLRYHAGGQRHADT